MRWPFRVTKPVLEVLYALLDADGPQHGWGIADNTGQGGPNVYRALRRLQDAGWVNYRWEEENPEPGKPRRRLYWLTAEGERKAPQLLAERYTEAPTELDRFHKPTDCNIHPDASR